MIPFVGSLQLVGLAVLVVVLSAVSLVAATWSAAFGRWTGSAVVSSASAGLVLVAAVVAVEWCARRRERRRAAEWVVDLATLAESEELSADAVGDKAWTLARLAHLGVPVPDGVVLTTALAQRIAQAASRGERDLFRALPRQARRELSGFLKSCGSDRVIIRASFAPATTSTIASFAGLFPAVSGVDPQAPVEVLAHVATLLHAADSAPVAAYRRRRGLSGRGEPRAVLIQRQMDGEETGVAHSRGTDGRADRVPIDWTPRGKRARSAVYDLVDRVALGAMDGAAGSSTPLWMVHLARLCVAVDDALGGAVRVEFMRLGQRLIVLQAARVRVVERKTWLRVGPVELGGERLPELVQDLRGGEAMLRDALSDVFSRMHVGSAPGAGEVRYVEGIAYVDADVFRRALAGQAAGLLFRLDSRHLRGLSARVEAPPASTPPGGELDELGWADRRQWHRNVFLPVARRRVELAVHRWLLRAALELTSSGKGSPDEAAPSLHPLLGRWFARQVAKCDRAVRETEEWLEKTEAVLAADVARLVSRGARAWNAMFMGETYRHARLEEIDRWLGDPDARGAIASEWRHRLQVFEEKEDQPPPERVHRPALVSSAGAPREGLGLVPGTAAGKTALVGRAGAVVDDGAIVVLPEGRAEYRDVVFHAAGLVILGGGALSPISVLAAELGVPTVLCDAARPARIAAGRHVEIDGERGVIRG